jgi:hypothetical protein
MSTPSPAEIPTLSASYAYATPATTYTYARPATSYACELPVIFYAHIIFQIFL